MRILALDTSTEQGSVALLERNHVVHETPLSSNCRAAQSLAPAMAALLQQADWSPASIGLVAVTNGPGSFTGLRIAVTAAKTFAYATQSRLIALNTLRVLVEQLPADTHQACALMDAQRRQLFFAVYQRARDGAWQTMVPCQIVDRDQLAPLLNSGTVLTGPVLSRLAPPFLADQPRAEPTCWIPLASTAGRLAWQAHQAGQSDDLLQLQPQYYRPSYAEEKSNAD